MKLMPSGDRKALAVIVIGVAIAFWVYRVGDGELMASNASVKSFSALMNRCPTASARPSGPKIFHQAAVLARRHQGGGTRRRNRQPQEVGARHAGHTLAHGGAGAGGRSTSTERTGGGLVPG